jgi:hypothetical protein
MQKLVCLLILTLGFAVAQNLTWSPVLGIGQTWRVSITNLPDFQLKLAAKNQRGFIGQAVSNNKIFNTEVFYRAKEDTLELILSSNSGTYACTFTSSKSVKGLSFQGTAYYLAPNAVAYQNLQQVCLMTYDDPNLRGAPVPAVGGAPVPAVGGAPVPALGGAPISAESLSRVIRASTPVSASPPPPASAPAPAPASASVPSTQAALPWQPVYNLGQTWDVVFEGLGTWTVNLFATEQNIPYGYAVGADTRVGLGIYVTKEQTGIGSDLSLFAVAGQKDAYYCILLPNSKQSGNTWQGIGAVQASGQELVATGKSCQISLR